MADMSLNDHALDILFRTARTHRAWKNEPISDDTLKDLYSLLKWGPTSANCCPARFVFVKSKEAKERLKPHLDSGNVEKSMTAPVTVIIAHDMKFYEQMPKLMPHMKDGKSMFTKSQEAISENAFRNGTLQGGYLIMAARALGLDCGPMSGFNPKGVKEEFFKGKDWEPNFLCNLGYGDASKIFPRSPRLEFDEACEIL